MVILVCDSGCLAQDVAALSSTFDVTVQVAAGAHGGGTGCGQHRRAVLVCSGQQEKVASKNTINSGMQLEY